VLSILSNEMTPNCSPLLEVVGHVQVGYGIFDDGHLVEVTAISSTSAFIPVSFTIAGSSVSQCRFMVISPAWLTFSRDGDRKSSASTILKPPFLRQRRASYFAAGDSVVGFRPTCCFCFASMATELTY
jgi:hypothetical protein